MHPVAVRSYPYASPSQPARHVPRRNMTAGSMLTMSMGGKVAERLLIVDDEANMRWVLKEALGGAGYEVLVAASGQEALDEMGRHPADLVVLDLKLKGMDGLATLRRITERWPETVVIILTAYGTVATAVEAMQAGAADYLRKPFDVEEISFKIQRALERKALKAEVGRLRRLRLPSSLDPPAGAHPTWQRCLAQVRSLTALELDILLLGEAGSGRATLARFAHEASDRRDAPLVELDLSAFARATHPLVLAGSATSDGAWSRAGGGTLLLRNADRLSIDGQASLLERASERRGQGPRLLLTAEALLPGLEALSAACIDVPPLRERRDDLLLIAQMLIPGVELAAPALEALERYLWPGNVAELRGVLARAAVLSSQGPIEAIHLPEHVREAARYSVPLPLNGVNMEEIEIGLLRQALERAGGNKTRAAELLGLTRHTLLYRIEKYGLEA